METSIRAAHFHSVAVVDCLHYEQVGAGLDESAHRTACNDLSNEQKTIL